MSDERVSKIVELAQDYTAAYAQYQSGFISQSGKLPVSKFTIPEEVVRQAIQAAFIETMKLEMSQRISAEKDARMDKINQERNGKPQGASATPAPKAMPEKPVAPPTPSQAPQEKQEPISQKTGQKKWPDNVTCKSCGAIVHGWSSKHHPGEKYYKCEKDGYLRENGEPERRR